MKKEVLQLFLLLSFFFSGKSALASENWEGELQRSIYNWNYFVRFNVDSLKMDGYKLLIRAEEVRSDLGKAVAFRSIGSGMIRKGQISHGRKYLKEALRLFEILEEEEMRVETLNEIGHSFMYENKPKQAILWYEKAKLSQDTEEAKLISASALLNKALALSSLNKFEQALKLINKYLVIVQKHEKWESVANGFASKGKIYLSQNDLVNAKQMFIRSAEYAKYCEAPVVVSHAINNLAIVAFQQQDLIESENQFLAALKIREEVGNINWILESLYNCGGFYFEKKDYETALKFYNQGDSISFANKLYGQTLEFILAKSELFEITDMDALVGNDKRYSEVNQLNEQLRKNDEEYERIVQEVIGPKPTKNMRKTTTSNWKIFTFLMLGLALPVLIVLKNRS